MAQERGKTERRRGKESRCDNHVRKKKVMGRRRLDNSVACTLTRQGKDETGK